VKLKSTEVALCLLEKHARMKCYFKVGYSRIKKRQNYHSFKGTSNIKMMFHKHIL